MAGFATCSLTASGWRLGSMVRIDVDGVKCDYLSQGTWKFGEVPCRTPVAPAFVLLLATSPAGPLESVCP